MSLKFDTTMDFFILFIIFIKIIFIISAVGHLILSHSSGTQAKNIDPKLVYWKERTEFIFVISMAILLIYNFNPRYTNNPVGHETSLLFFLFGWILILTAKWSLFFKVAPWYNDIFNT